MRLFRGMALLAILPLYPTVWAQSAPVISLVANAEGENPVIAPNTWIEIKGTHLSNNGDTRVWQASDFLNNQLPAALDGVSVTVNGKTAYVYYISPTQVNVLTPPDAMPASVSVQVTNNGQASAAFTVKAQTSSPSFFVINGGPYVVAQHSADYSLVGAASLYPGASTPAKAGETVLLYANGFGPTTPAAVSGAIGQSGTVSPLPVISIGGIAAQVQFAGLISPGLFQINVVIPSNVPSGDNAIAAVVNGVPVAPVGLITVQGAGAMPTAVTMYVTPNGNDFWSGRLASPNAAATDGPFATLDHARQAVQNIVKAGLTQVTVQIRGGTYSLASPVQFGAADSGAAGMGILYQNYPGEIPVFEGGVRVTNWTHGSGNAWKATLPASTRNFENLFYNGVRRLRPRLGANAANPLGTYYRVGNTVYLNAPPPPATAPSQPCSAYVAGSGWECFDRFQYNASDPIAGTWKNLAPASGNPCGQTAGNQAIAGDIEVLDFEQFSTSKLRISCVDTANHIVYMTGPTGFSQNNASQGGFITGNRYMVENVADALTQPGQWFLDRSVTPWTLTYLANTGEDPNADTVIIPQAPQLLVASNLQYVTFQGLVFQHDNYVVPAGGHASSELESDIPAAVSFQNTRYVTFDSGTVTQTSGTGLEMIPCLNGTSPAYCVATSLSATVTNNVVQNSAFYDLGVMGIRIGNPYQPVDTDSNEPQFTTVQNNVVEGYGRTIPAAFGIGQGMGHDNLYTHNDVYDGYHCAISTSQSIADSTAPAGMGNAKNVISFNHVWNLLQGIMNDGGSIRIDGGNTVFTAAGNKVLNNRIHDVTDASIMDANGYGGHGVYLDDSTGMVDVENNLIYRVSGYGVYTPHGPAGLNQENIVRNNIVAYARLGMVAVNNPYLNGAFTTIPQSFVYSNNIFYFDKTASSNPKFLPDGGCVYSDGFPFTAYQLWQSNLYWRTDGGFATDPDAFGLQGSAGTGPQAPCNGNMNKYTFYTFANWQSQVGEDLKSVVQNPGFNNAAYPADDYTLPHGSPGVGCVVFDISQMGRSHVVLKPPAVAATFPTMSFNAMTDY